MAEKTAKKLAPGIKLGSLVKDTITEFTGIAISRVEFGFGCIHIRIQPQALNNKGEPVLEHSFDDQRVEVLEPPTKSWTEPKQTSVQLGNLVQDTLTGAIGIASGKVIGLDGQVDFIIEQPGLTPNGEPKVPISANSAHVVLVDKRELKVSKDSAATSGGPMARNPINSGGSLR